MRLVRNKCIIIIIIIVIDSIVRKSRAIVRVASVDAMRKKKSDK